MATKITLTTRQDRNICKSFLYVFKHEKFVSTFTDVKYHKETMMAAIDGIKWLAAMVKSIVFHV